MLFARVSTRSLFRLQKERQFFSASLVHQKIFAPKTCCPNVFYSSVAAAAAAAATVSASPIISLTATAAGNTVQSSQSVINMKRNVHEFIVRITPTIRGIVKQPLSDLFAIQRVMEGIKTNTWRTRWCHDPNSSVKLFEFLVDFQYRFNELEPSDQIASDEQLKSLKYHAIRNILITLQMCKDHRASAICDVIHKLFNDIPYPYVEAICALVETEGDALDVARKLYQTIKPHLMMCARLPLGEPSQHPESYYSCTQCQTLLNPSVRARVYHPNYAFRWLVHAFAAKDESIVNEIFDFFRELKIMAVRSNDERFEAQVNLSLECCITAYLASLKNRSISSTQVISQILSLYQDFIDVMAHSIRQHNILLGVLSDFHDDIRLDKFYGKMKDLHQRGILTLEPSTFIVLLNSCKQRKGHGVRTDMERAKHYLAEMEELGVQRNVPFLNAWMEFCVLAKDFNLAKQALTEILSNFPLELGANAFTRSFNVYLIPLSHFSKVNYSQPEKQEVIKMVIDIMQKLRKEKSRFLTCTLYDTVLSALTKANSTQAFTILNMMMIDKIEFSRSTMKTLVELFTGPLAKEELEPEVYKTLAIQLTQLLKKMTTSNDPPSLELLTICIMWYSTHNMNEARDLFDSLVAQGSFKMDSSLCGALVRAYGERNDIDGLSSLYHTMRDMEAAKRTHAGKVLISFRNLNTILATIVRIHEQCQERHEYSEHLIEFARQVKRNEELKIANNSSPIAKEFSQLCRRAGI